MSTTHNENSKRYVKILYSRCVTALDTRQSGVTLHISSSPASFVREAGTIAGPTNPLPHRRTLRVALISRLMWLPCPSLCRAPSSSSFLLWHLPQLWFWERESSKAKWQMRHRKKAFESLSFQTDSGWNYPIPRYHFLQPPKRSL